MRTIHVQERRARLARRHRLAPGAHAADAVDVANSLVALHATDPPTVVLSVHARTTAVTHDDVGLALHVDRSLVRMMAMRRTLWVVPTDLAPAVLAGAGARVAAAERRRLAKEVAAAGLHDDGAAWIDAACAQVLDVLADGGERSSTELREAAPLLDGELVYGEGKSWGGSAPVGPRVLTILLAEGRVLRGTNDGGWYVSRPRYTTTERWLGAPLAEVDTAVAVAELVRAWLRSFGPGTEDDIVWWLGSTKGLVRAALATLDAVRVDLDGSVGYVLPDDVEPVEDVEPWVALLPVLDPTTMGWKDRDWYVGGHRALLYDTAGNGGATIWCDGALVGGWWQREDGTVITELLEDIGAEATDAVAARADALSSWFDGRRVMPRFPSPLAVQRARD